MGEMGEGGEETGEGRGGCGDSRVINGLDRLDVHDTNITTLAAKPFQKRCNKIILGKSHSISQWRRKVQETKLGTSLETLKHA